MTSEQVPPSLVLDSSLKWPPHDSFRSKACRQMISANLKKSATRPACSCLIKFCAVSQDVHVFPELGTHRRYIFFPNGGLVKGDQEFLENFRAGAVGEDRYRHRNETIRISIRVNTDVP
jgi:hypothetical protein